MNEFLVAFLLGVVLVTSGVAIMALPVMVLVRSLSSATRSRGSRNRH